MSSQAKAHQELVEYGLQEYETAVVDALLFAIDDGQVPGVERSSRREIVSFFRSVDPMEWTALAARDPETALTLFEQWRIAEAS